MGKSSKKKKKRGHGASARKSKDYASHSGDETDIIMEELTVLEATYQEDLKIVSKSPFVVNLNIRPYSRDTGFDDLDMSAVLSVRYIPGYPNKCPKFHVTPGEGLSEEDASRLLLLLQDQAIVNAREGRVMIFNLVEAAKEFLSEIIPQGQSTEFVSNTIVDKKDQLAHQDMETSGDNTHYFRGPFVYGLVDLFIGYKDSLNWDHGTEKIRGGNLSVVGHSLDPLNIGYRSLEKKVHKNGKSLTLKDPKKNSTQPPLVKLHSLREERETDRGSTSNDSNGSDSEESEEHGFIIEDHESTIEDSKDNDSDLEDKPSLPLTSIKYDQESSWAMKKDLIMVHLLRLACASKGPLSDSLQEISSELYRLGIFSEWAKDLAAKPLQFFKEDFVNSFGEHMGLSLNPQFWDSSDLEVSASRPSSRYHNDFEEIASLGHGGFGHVSLCRNKLDGRQYAVKRIPLEDKSLTLNDRILREVATLSRLQHQHVVRFYQAWVETEVGAGYNDLTWGSTASSSGYSLKGSSSTYVAGTDNKQESTFLYIQMEYCPRTLRQVFESYGSVFGKELAWHLFRQIVEGLAHIHAQGIIHRDLTPSNIFFDARNDIKIGDFGLAKFLKLEQLDHEPNPIGTTGNTVDGTGHVGTYFYTAPEIEQEWPKIDEKADMYSLGVVFFELWHPFNTAMERHVVLSDLKNKGSPPTAWVAEYPEQAALLQRLMSPSPSNRPSTTELLQHDLPPRMEDEWLDDVLRAIQSPEDTRVYEKVVQKIFDEERLATKALHQRCIKVNLGKEDSFFSQCTELETEIRDHVEEVAKGAFRQHCAKRLETTLLSLLDESPQFNRNAVKLLTKDGDVLELCHEMRLPFVSWIVTNQKSSFRRYELSWVYRNSVGHSTPNRYLQGDFDIVGGAVSVTEAEIIKVAMDIVTSFFHSNSCHIRLNHAYLLDAIWCWVGIEAELRESVAQCLSVMGSLCPQSSKRKSSWTLVRRQLLQDLKLAEGVVNRLQTVDSRFCGYADQALPRLMGALPPDRRTRKALEELSALFSYLRIWKIEKNVFIDALMLPAENYHQGLFFQVFSDGTLLAVGGRYDHLLCQMWDPEYKSLPPGAVGISLALENIVRCSSVENKPSRSEAIIEVLVCSRGGGGMLNERMELVSELWEANIKAAFVPIPEPSLTEQYEYADEHGIKCLIIITEAGLSQTGLIKVRHLEFKKEKEVQREKLVEFLTNAATSQFRNISGRN